MGGTAMIFAPARLGSVTLDNETLAADKKGCRRFGPCGVGEKALYLNSFFIDRHYYVALSSVRRVFKRVAMSKGGFTGKGAFGSIPYLVVEYDGGEKQCNFKHEEDVDTLLDLMKQAQVTIPLKAVVTPSNRNWVFGDLLAHLQEEHTAFTAAKENQPV